MSWWCWLMCAAGVALVIAYLHMCWAIGEHEKRRQDGGYDE